MQAPHFSHFFYSTDIRKGSRKIVLHIVDHDENLVQFNFDGNSCHKRSLQVGFQSLNINNESLGGMMFKNLPIPRLSKINSARIKLKLVGDAKGSSGAKIKIFAKITGDISYLSSCLHNDTKQLGNFVIFRLERTPQTNETIWTPDISSTLQERVNEVSYAPGTGLVIVLAPVKGDGNELFYFNFLNDFGPPVLELDYTPPSKYGPTEKIVTSKSQQNCTISL